MNTMHLASPQADGFVDTTRTQTEMVTQEIAAALNVAFRDVLPESALVADLGATLADLQILRVGLELTFNLHVPIEHVRAWRTVQDIQTYVYGRLSAERITG